MDCFLVSRGVKTLAVRMERHNSNGLAIAKHLEAHPKVKKVIYPGLASHPRHELAKKQQSGFGGMISFEVGSLEAAKQVLNHTKLCSLAESLGGVESMISLPALMTHASIPPEIQAQIGITQGLIRLSVGIEDVEDLIADLDAAGVTWTTVPPLGDGPQSLAAHAEYLEWATAEVMPAVGRIHVQSARSSTD